MKKKKNRKGRKRQVTELHQFEGGRNLAKNFSLTN